MAGRSDIGDEVEAARLNALQRLDVLDSAPEPLFDDLVRLAALEFGVPVAAISLVARDRVWAKASFGLEAAEAPRQGAFCDQAIRSSEVTVVPDSRQDERFSEHQMVREDLAFRFYAGAPLTLADGSRVGALCVIDFQPRDDFDAAKAERLKALATSVAHALGLRAEGKERERQARLAEDRLKLLSLAEQMAGVGTWSWDVVEARSSWSKEVYHIHGHDPSLPPLTGDEAFTAYHPDDAGQLAAQMERALTEGVSFSQQSRMIGPDGSIRHVLTKAEVRLGADGKVAAVYGTLQDVTDLKLADFALRDSEARLRFLTEHTSDLIMRYDLSYRRLFISESVRRYGYEPEELVGRPGWALNHPDDSPKMRALIEDLIAGRMADEDAYLEIRLRTKAGAWVWMEAAPNLVRDASGVVAEFVWVMRDITARKAAETALAESEARYRMMADHASDIIVRYDVRGIIEYISPSIRRLGYTPEEMIGTNVSGYGHPEDEARMSQVRAGLSEGRAYADGLRTERRIRAKDGRMVWFEGNPSTLHDDQGRIIGAVSLMRDISARRAMEDELRRRQAEAEAATIAKSEFLANMSHEIRTPLTAVVGFAGLLQAMSGLPDRAQVFVDRIGAGSQALLAIVNDILDFSRMEAGQIELNPQPFDPLEFVSRTVDLVRNEAAKKGLSLDVEVEGALPERVKGDSGRLGQVLLNLLNNAVKFTDRGGVRVRVSHFAGPAPRLRIAVVDTGVGIEPGQSQRLFERFTQADGSSTRQYGGAGLGLAISKGLIELMGGAIGVESEPGRGSTFWFEAPGEVADAAPRPAAPETTPVRFGPARILMVDDVQTNRELVQAMLAPFSLQLSEAANGAEAVEAARREAFDLILMDLQMPVMDGLAAARAIRAEADLNRATPILALSANVLPAHVEACREAGMDGHVAKPIRPEELLTKIAYWTDPDGQSVGGAR